MTYSYSKNNLILWAMGLTTAAILLGWCLPWLSTPGVSLSFNAYDLAEWTSLNPVVRSANPTLLLTLLLRLPLPCLALAVIWLIRNPILRLIIVGVIALALLPPLEFFTGAGADPNYQQQFALAIASLILGLLAFVKPLQKARLWIVIALLLLGLVGSLVGLLQTLHLMEDFKVPVQVGIGGVLTLIGLLLLTAQVISLWTKEKAG